MSYNEIVNEMIEDYSNCSLYIQKISNKYRRAVIKSSKFPVSFKVVEYITKRNNNFLIYLSAHSKRDANSLFRTIVCYYEFNNKIRAIMCTPIEVSPKIIIYTHHFFERYRERFLKSDISIIETIKIYFLKNYANAGFFINDNEIKASCHDGYLFLEEISNDVQIAKTFVTREMLFENQRLEDKFNIDALEELEEMKKLKEFNYMFNKAG